MNLLETKEARRKILGNAVNDDRLQIAIDYLNTKYIPNEIGITYNSEFEYEKYRYGGFFFNKKFLHLVLRNDTVDAIVGSGVNSRRTSKTYSAHVYVFETAEEAKLFSDYSNTLYNRN